MKAIITIGISGCGKTTWAKKQPFFTVLSRDDIRVKLHEEANPSVPFQFHLWKWKNEDKVTEIQNRLIESNAAHGNNIIIADTNLNRGRLSAMMGKLSGLGYDVELKYFHGIDADEHIYVDKCIKNDINRAVSVGYETIHRQWKQFTENYPGSIRKYVPDVTKPKAIIVDIDGTVAKKGDRDVFDYSNVLVDTPISHVVDIVSRFVGDYHIIFCSGRDDICYDDTIVWLTRHNIHFDYLYMRKTGDVRRDSIIKEEIFFEHIAEKFNVIMAIDDRDQMISCWTDLGINTINVGNIYDHF